MSSDSDRTGSSQGDALLPRRVVLKGVGATVIGAWLLPLTGCGDSSAPSAAPGVAQGTELFGPNRPTPRASFFTDAEMDTLRALIDRLIPGGVKPGALDAQCELAIDGFLAAFQTDPPMIYAGGPYSDRGGASDNAFARFIPLDDYEELAWRNRIEGSRGIPELEVNGPVVGLQQIFRDGLAQLEARAQALGFASFSALPALARDAIVLDSRDAQVQALVDVAFPETLNAMYGAPEYGGNRNQVGWTSNGFDGDVHPRGYTDAQVINNDQPLLIDAWLPPSYDGSLALPEPGTAAAATPLPASAINAALGLLPLMVMSTELADGIVASAEGSLARLRAQLQPLTNSRAMLRWEA